MGAGRGKCLWMPGAASAQHLTGPAALPCPGCQRGREVTPEAAPGQQRGCAASSSHRGMPLSVPHSLCHRSLRLRASHHPSLPCSLRELCGSSGRALPSRSITGRESRLLRLGKGMPTSGPPSNSWDEPSQHHSRTALGTEGFSPHSPRSRLCPTSWTWPKSQWVGYPGKSASARSSSRRRWNSWMAFSSTHVRQKTAARCSTLETSTPSHSSFMVPVRAAGRRPRCPAAPRPRQPMRGGEAGPESERLPNHGGACWEGRERKGSIPRERFARRAGGDSLPTPSPRHRHRHRLAPRRAEERGKDRTLRFLITYSCFTRLHPHLHPFPSRILADSSRSPSLSPSLPAAGSVSRLPAPAGTASASPGGERGEPAPRRAGDAGRQPRAGTRQLWHGFGTAW